MESEQVLTESTFTDVESVVVGVVVELPPHDAKATRATKAINCFICFYFWFMFTFYKYVPEDGVEPSRPFLATGF